MAGLGPDCVPSKRVPRVVTLVDEGIPVWQQQKVPRSAPTQSAEAGYDHDHSACRGGGALPP